MPYAIFCCLKKKNRSIDPPCLDPLDFGKGDEPKQDLLLRRGRVALFTSREHAEAALRATGKSFPEFAKNFSFLILECFDRTIDE